MNDANNERELTLRAVLTGVVIGALLTPCNIYSGLKIGWSFNMSITAALLSYGFWRGLRWYRPGVGVWGIRENAMNQTSASSAASIVSGGLVAPIPAYTIITGNSLPAWSLIGWVFAVSCLGIFVAFGLREQLLVRERAVFPAGVATAETLQNIYAHGREALMRVIALAVSGVVAAAVKLLDAFWGPLSRLAPTTVWAGGALRGGGGVTGANLTFGIEPSMLLLGFGAIIGIRAGLSLLAGAIIGWGVVAPLAIGNGWIEPGSPDASASWFGVSVEWLLWPGVALMVASSLTSFVLALVGLRLRKVNAAERTDSRAEVESEASSKHSEMPRNGDCSAGTDVSGSGSAWCKPGFWIGLSIVTLLVVALQMGLFGIDWWIALLAVPVAFVLGIVAARVVADTGIPPIGALGKVSQVTFAALAPGQVVANLMTANVAGGTAGQCSDLMNDLKTGHLLGVRPRNQGIAQFFGILTGAVVGSLVYLILIPDPQGMLITDEWAAPAVATWKAVAEALGSGLGGISLSARWSIVIGAMIGVLIEVGRCRLSRQASSWLPSAPALGLAFVIPASFSITMGAGAVLVWALFAADATHSFAKRFSLAIAAGLVAGESLAGVIESIVRFSF